VKKERSKDQKMNEAAVALQPECQALIVVAPKPEEIEMPLALVPAKRNPSSYAHLSKIAAQRKKQTTRRILALLYSWEDDRKYPGIKGGFIDNMVDVFKHEGNPIGVTTLRAHLLELAIKKEIYLERMVYDPNRTYKPKVGKIPTGYYCEYYVAMTGDTGEHGLVECVYHEQAPIFAERDKKGHFKRKKK
jgi:hypothetical protein